MSQTTPETHKKSMSWFILWVIIELLFFWLALPVLWLIGHIIVYFTNYITFGDKEVVMSTGLFNKKLDEVRYDKINSIKINQSWLGSMFNYGDIIIFTGSDMGGLAFKAINDPNRVKNILKNKIDTL